MSDDDLVDELAAENPLPSDLLRAAIPRAVGDAVLDEITASHHASAFRRLTDPLLVTLTSTRARFVTVVAIVAVAGYSFSISSFGGEATTTEPATSMADAAAPDASPSPERTPEPDPATTLVVTASTTSTSAAAQTTHSIPSASPTSEAVATTGPSTTGRPVTTGPSGDVVTMKPRDPSPEVADSSSCLVVEAESFPLVGAWSTRDDAGASGGRYIVWEGLSGERNNNAPTDVISIPIDVTTTGTYRFVWAMRQPSGVAGDRANDSWVNAPDAARFGPEEGGRYGGFVKVFGTARDTFGWSARADQHNTRSDVSIDFARPGRYTLQLAGRSHGHQIDRLLIHHESIVRSDAIAGRCGPAPDPVSTTRPPEPDPDPVVAGPYDPATDLISLHYDHAPDHDDGHATVAGRVVTESLGITPWVVGGAYGVNAGSYQPGSERVMDATWGPGGWSNADDDWGAAVTATADRWEATLVAGGAVWVAEGGQSDLTADVVRELMRRRPGLDTGRIHVVQHSDWNEDMTSAAGLRFVRDNTDYIRIDDGNGRNRTADLRAVTPGFATRARNSAWGPAWDAAFDYLDPRDRLDFSDTVELLHIVGIGTNEVATTSDFADRFLG